MEPSASAGQTPVAVKEKSALYVASGVTLSGVSDAKPGNRAFGAPPGRVEKIETLKSDVAAVAQ